MNDYFYKPNKTSLPKIQSSSPTTYYNTFYSGKSNNKTSSAFFTKKRINTDENLLNSNNNINNNKTYYNTDKNFSYEKLIKNKRRKLKPYFLPSNDISVAETDDTIFALSEIRHIDKLINKRIKKNLIWKQKTNNIYDVATSKNKKDIKEVRERVRHNLSGSNYKLKKSMFKNSYLPEEKFEIITDAQEIMNKIKGNMLKEKKVNKNFHFFNRIDLHTFTRQNRDICLKNIFINLIKDESNKIKTKEEQIQKALEEAKVDFNKDKEAFDEFKSYKKKSFKETEIQLDEAIKKNKVYMEEIKKINSELHSTKDEIDRNIRDIILYKNYADFVHQIIHKDENMEKVDMNKINLINKEKDIDITVKNILDEFSFLLDDYQFEYNEELNNPQILSNLFTTMESNIINTIDERDLILKERNKNKKKFEKELNNLRMKLESDKNELEKLNEEMNSQYIVNSPKRDFRKILDENEEYISIIYNELIKITKQKKIIQNNNICYETLNTLHQIEDELLVLFNEMDKINEIEKEKGGDGIFKSIIDKVKFDNKIEKYLESKEIMRKIQEEKNRKYQQRMNRYKIRGPIRYPPPHVLQKNKQINNININKKGDDIDMLYYN